MLFCFLQKSLCSVNFLNGIHLRAFHKKNEIFFKSAASINNLSYKMILFFSKRMEAISKGGMVHLGFLEILSVFCVKHWRFWEFFGLFLYSK